MWMMKNKISMYDSKVEFQIFRYPYLKENLNDLFFSLGDTQILSSSKVRNIRVVFDQYPTFHDDISGICKSTHFHLRNIGRIRNLYILMPLHTLFMETYYHPVHRFRSWPTQMRSPSHPHTQARMEPRNIYNHTYIQFLPGQNNLIINPDKTTRDRRRHSCLPTRYL